jgi:hypothetical protein
MSIHFPLFFYPFFIKMKVFNLGCPGGTYGFQLKNGLNSCRRCEKVTAQSGSQPNVSLLAPLVAGHLLLADAHAALTVHE